MIRNIRFLAFFLSLALLVSGCSFFQPVRLYEDKKNQFSILLPRNWKQEKANLKGMAILVKDPKYARIPNKFQANINVIVKDMPAEISMEQFFEANKQEIENTIPNVKNMEESRIFSGFNPGRSLYFESKLTAITLIFNTAAWFSRGRVYIVTCVASEDDYRIYKRMFKRILHSMRLH